MTALKHMTPQEASATVRPKPDTPTARLLRNPHLTNPTRLRNVWPVSSAWTYVQTSRPHRRRRARHSGSDQADAGANRRDRGGNRRQRRRRAQSGRRPLTGSHHPRPQPAGAERGRGVPHSARALGCQTPADHHPDGAQRRRRPRRRPGAGRRRLRHQAVQLARAHGPRPSRTTARHACRATGRRPATAARIWSPTSRRFRWLSTARRCA